MKKIRSIRLYNFQSHADTTVDFDAGMNAITGFSDQGKTAIFRAINWVLYNRPLGATFMRVDTHNCFVQLEFTDGYIVTRGIKTNKKDKVEDSYYTVHDPEGNRKDFRGFATNPPQEVLSAHGMGKIEWDEDNDTSLNLAEQHDRPFLLAESNGIKAKAIGKLNGVFVIDAALLDVAAEIRFNKETQKQREKELEKCNEELKEFAYLQDFGEKVNYFEKRLAELKIKYAKFVGGNVASAKRTNLTASKELHQQYLMETEGIEKVSEMLDGLWRSVTKRDKLSNLTNTKTHLDGRLVKGSAYLGKTAGVEGIIARCEELLKIVAKRDVLSKSTTKRGILLQSVDDERAEAERLRGIEDIITRLGKLIGLISLRDSLGKLVEERKDLQRRRSKGLTHINDLAKRYNVVVDEYTKVVSELGHCPICASEITDAEEVARKTLA